MTTAIILPNELQIAKTLIYDNCGLHLTNLTLNTESLEYHACSFELNTKKIQYRLSKITPRKTGQFVTIWKRNIDGITEPFNISDDLDFIIIAAKRGNDFGQFIFPKSMLAEKGIRIYPPWDIVTSKQAEKTQIWQTEYFFTIDDKYTTNIDLIRKLLI